MKKIMSTDPVVLALVKRLDGIRERVEGELDVLKTEFTEKADVIQESAKVEHEACWAELYALLNIDPDLDYNIDGDYIEDCGVLFIIKLPPRDEIDIPEGSLASMLKQALGND